jgi:phage shock protein A
MEETMTDDKAVPIAEDLREHYEECGKYQNAHLILCRRLIERASKAESNLAASEHNLSLERGVRNELEQECARLKAEIAELQADVRRAIEQGDADCAEIHEEYGEKFGELS